MLIQFYIFLLTLNELSGMVTKIEVYDASIS